MQTYIVSFTILLCLGISMRLIHPGSAAANPAPLIVALFLGLGALMLLAYRCRTAAYLFLIAAISAAFLGLPALHALNPYMIWAFAVLAAIAVGLNLLKLNGILPWTLSALFLGYGITSAYKNTDFPTHLSNWATDNWGQQSLIYGTVVKEPEIRPEVDDTRLTVEPAVVIRLLDPEAKGRISAILEVLGSLGRQWKNEGEALKVLLEVRDKIAAVGPEGISEEKRAAVIIKGFSGGGFTLQPGSVSSVEAALAALAVKDDPLGLTWTTRITDGWIFATIKDTEEQAQTYLDLSHYTGYGNVVKIVGSLRAPYPSSNPGGFDYQKMLNNTNYFAMMTITGKESRDRETDTIEIVEEKMGNPFIAWCLGIKYELLDVIRKTTPFPDSGFLSGIFLGLRRGVPEKIMEDSRVAGTAHVFAVSGLHVTIITGLLLLIFSQTPIPKTVWAPIAVLFLCVFTIITGARPSTLRAATMNIFVLIFFTYFGKNILKSLIMSICFAATVILTIYPAGYGGPLIMPEASFLMSFSAVLFLGMMSQPVEHFLNTRLNSLARMMAFVLVWVAAGLFFINLSNPFAIFTSKLFLGLLGATVAAVFIQNLLPFRVRFTSIPSHWLRQFIAAQIAIQCSIIPLSAVIFHRVSLAAPFANFIAIPLIGIVLPLGMIASLIGFIPGIGIYIALLLTAANWLGMRFFLILDDWCYRLFPYPQVPEWGSPILIVFYAGTLVFIYREKLALSLKITYHRVKNSLAFAPCRVRFGAAGVALLISAAALALGFKSASKPEMIITFLDLSYPARGMAAIVEAPNGDNFLIDGGFEGMWGSYAKRYVNQGMRGLSEVLLAKGIISFEGVVSTNFDSALLGGLNFIVSSPDYRVKKLYVYIPPDRFGPQDINLYRFQECLAPRARNRAEALYAQLMLGYWSDPNSVIEFQSHFEAIERAKITAFVSELAPETRTLAENALNAFDEKKQLNYEELIESILSTYAGLGDEFEREKAEEIAARWNMPLLKTEDYRELLYELPAPVVWFVYREAGAVSSLEGLAAYLDDLRARFVDAVGDSQEIYREDEKFLQYHRLMYWALKKNLELSPTHYGLHLIKEQEVGGAVLKAEILGPPEERFQGRYVSDANSAVLRFQYGEHSVLMTSLINQQASEWLLELKDGIASTVYQIPEFGRGGRYVNTERMLESVNPEIAVFHYKGGRYVDKRYQEVYDLCRAKNIRTLNTPDDGAVIVRIRPDGYQAESMLGGQIGEAIEVTDENAAPARESELGGGM